MARQYTHYDYNDAEALCCARYVFPTVLRLAGEIPQGTRVLDVGCGNGALAGLFLDRGCRTVGVDISEPGVGIARATYPNGRFEVLPADEHVRARLSEPPFDVVVSTEVIEHLYAPSAFLKGCFDALRPGGRLVLSTPYHGYWKNVALAVAGKVDRHVHPQIEGGHIKFWSRRTLGEVLQQAGFTDIEFAGAGRVPLLWKSMVMAANRPKGA